MCNPDVMLGLHYPSCGLKQPSTEGQPRETTLQAKFRWPNTDWISFKEPVTLNSRLLRAINFFHWEAGIPCTEASEISKFVNCVAEPLFLSCASGTPNSAARAWNTAKRSVQVDVPAGPADRKSSRWCVIWGHPMCSLVSHSRKVLNVANAAQATEQVMGMALSTYQLPLNLKSSRQKSPEWMGS